jgi:putative SOS response-associated peptidase YedK
MDFMSGRKWGRKPLYRIGLQKLAHKPFSFAGLWEEFEDEDDSMVHARLPSLPFYQIQLISVLALNERMPVIFDKVQEDIWLNSHSSEIELSEHPEHAYAFQHKMGIYTVSSLINNPAKDHPSLILPSTRKRSARKPHAI